MENPSLQRLNNLFQKIKLSSPTNENGFAATRSKFKNIQSVILKFRGDLDSMAQEKETRLEVLAEKMYKLQTQITEEMNKREAKQKLLATKITKIQKNCKRSLDTLTKEKNDMDKKLNSYLETCLSDITAHRSKLHSECNLSVKQLGTLLPQIDELQQEVENESLINQEHLKKIYNQFSQQIDELKEAVEEQKIERQKQQESIIKKLEETYKNIHLMIINHRKNREKSEKMLVDLLERVIDKVKKQLAGN